MAYVEGKCKCCGGIMQIDPERRAAFCPYCGTPYVEETITNNYTTHIDNLHADVVNVNSDKSAKARLEAAEAFMKLEQYANARIAFKEASDLTPQDYQGWWGQVRASTNNFTRIIETKSELDAIYSLYKSALVFVPSKEKQKLEKQFMNFYQPLLKKNCERCDSLRAKIERLNREHKDLISSIKGLSGQQYLSIGSMPSWLSVLVFILAVLGIIAAEVTDSIVIFGLSCIPLAFGIVWEIIIVPISNSISCANRKKRDCTLKELCSQRDRTTEELSQAQMLFHRYSN